MDNDKDIEIKREEDLGLDEKIKAGAKAVGRKIGDPESDIGSEYDTEKIIERVDDWEKIKIIDIWITLGSQVTEEVKNLAETINKKMNNLANWISIYILIH